MKRYLSLFLALALVGCGGGDDSSNDDTPATASAPTLTLGTASTAQYAAVAEGADAESGAVAMTLTIAEAGNYQCDAHATGHDAQMAIFQGTNEIARDSDSGEGVDAQITQQLEAGAYEVRVWEWRSREDSISVTCAVAPAAAAEPAAAGGGSNFGTVTLAPNFMPDPHTATGAAGGPTHANTLDSSCAGWVSDTPDHLLVTSGDFANLRIMTSSEEDTTLVIRMPDGSYRCDDDGSGVAMNPLVTGAFPAGTYQIHIGTYSAEATGVAYTLGFSELDNIDPSAL